MTRTETAVLFATTVLMALGAAASITLPRRLEFGLIRLPPDCGRALFEVCDKPQGRDQCHWEHRFTCEAGAPSYHRLYRDPFKEDR